jgi:hypothetical protein
MNEPDYTLQNYFNEAMRMGRVACCHFLAKRMKQNKAAGLREFNVFVSMTCH